MSLHVIVVGAGFAGAAAADAVRAGGARVTVLEARDRIGGRVWSHRFDDGLVVERGGELVEEWYGTMRGMVERFGLELTPGPARIKRFPLFRGGVELTDATEDEIVEAVETAFRALAAMVPGLVETGEVTAGAEAERLDGMSVAAGLDAIGMDGLARTWLETLVSGWSCRETHEESLLAFVAARAWPQVLQGLSRDRFGHRVVGGNGQIARGLLAPLGDDVRLRAQVTGVAHHPGAVTVATIENGVERRIAADAVVLAVPFTALGRIAFDPPLPARLVEAISGRERALGVKMTVRHDAWADLPPAFMSAAPRFQAWRAGAGDGPGATTMYVAGDAALRIAEASETQRADLARCWLGAIAPSAGRGHAIVTAWPADRYALACSPMYRPGDFLRLRGWPLSKVGDALWLAGEHVSPSEFGSMEGALSTGVAAGSDILARLA